MSEVIVLATVSPLPGMEAEVEREFAALLQPTHAERGCELYALHRVRERPGQLVFIERWSSQEDLDAHAASDHLAACGRACESKLQAPVDVVILEPLHGGDPAMDRL
jgi:quinol monooxygenase YgiN